MKIQFEKDEEGEWRAILNEQGIQTNKTITEELLTAIVESIEYITK